MATCKKCGKEFEGENIYCNRCRWEMKWPDEILNAPELASRRKRSHHVHLVSVDRKKCEAVFLSSKGDKEYTATLGHCTCKDFALTRGEIPCKHILRLAEELGLFQSERFEDNENDYTLRSNFSDMPSDRKILPEALRCADDALIETYISILRFFFWGRKRQMEKLEGKLLALDSEEFLTENKVRVRANIQKKLCDYRNFEGEAREIKRYQSISDDAHSLYQLATLGVVELKNTLSFVGVQLPFSVTLARIENILKTYGEYFPMYSQKVSANPLITLENIVRTQRRSEEILRPYDATDTPSWAFYVPSYFNDSLDIRLISRMKNSVEYVAWTQGINFSFDRGYMLYRDRETYIKGTPAIQIISAKRAYGTKTEELDLGTDMSSAVVDDYVDGLGSYYPGEVIYRDFDAGDVETKTQMDFVKMLIGIS